MTITLDQIKELREKTGAGVTFCKKALEETNGDMDKAAELMRKQGIAKAEKRADKSAAEGIVGSYIHSNNKVAALVEVNCETDFSAKSDTFVEFAHDLAMQVAAMNPLYKDINSIPTEILEKEKKFYREEIIKEGKPENMVDKIIEGKLRKYYEDNCLLNQKFFKDDSKTIQDYLNEIIAKIGEKIEIGRFVRISVG